MHVCVYNRRYTIGFLETQGLSFSKSRTPFFRAEDGEGVKGSLWSFRCTPCQKVLNNIFVVFFFQLFALIASATQYNCLCFCFRLCKSKLYEVRDKLGFVDAILRDCLLPGALGLAVFLFPRVCVLYRLLPGHYIKLLEAVHRHHILMLRKSPRKTWMIPSDPHAVHSPHAKTG